MILISRQTHCVLPVATNIPACAARDISSLLNCPAMLLPGDLTDFVNEVEWSKCKLNAQEIGNYGQ
jgi:hypothetical protein